MASEGRRYIKEDSLVTARTNYPAIKLRARRRHTSLRGGGLAAPVALVLFSDPEALKEFDALGYQGTPVVVAGDKHWAGTDIIAWDKIGGMMQDVNLRLLVVH